MRIRMSLFALLATAGLMLSGCGEEKKDPPPGAVDADTPNVEVDEGIELPDAGDAKEGTKEDDTKEGDTKEEAKKEAE